MGSRRPDDGGGVARLPGDTERMRFRPFTLDDADAVHGILGDPETMRYMPRGACPSLNVTRAVIERWQQIDTEHGFTLWALIEKASGRLIGDCGLIPVEGKGPEVEIGYHLARDCWGRSLAAEAAAEVLRFGGSTLGLQPIIAVIEPEHRASRRVAEKIGMESRGQARYYEREMALYSTPEVSR